MIGRLTSLPCDSALKDFPPDTMVTFITINIDLATLVDVNTMYNINADESQMESLARIKVTQQFF